MQHAMEKAGLYEKARKIDCYKRAFHGSRRPLERLILHAQGHSGPRPLYAAPIHISPTLRQVYVTLGHEPNWKGVRKVTSQYIQGARTEASWLEAMLSGNFPTKRVREERETIEREAARKRTRAEATGECPRCRKQALHTRVYQAADKGSCGGKAAMRSHERCAACGYECRQ